MRAPLTEALARQAYLRALLDGTTPQGALALTPPQGSGVNVRRAQQQGGMRSRPGGSSAEGRGGGIGSLLGSVAGAALGGPLWSIAGSVAGGLLDGGSTRSSSAGRRRSSSLGEQHPALGEQFRTVLGNWLSGESSGLPGAYYQEALSRGIAGINRQAQLSRERMLATLGQRGLLNSGAVVRGLAEVERGRLGSLADYHGAMQQQDIASRREALLTAMEIMARSREQAAAAQAAREQIRMQQPTTWDYLAQLAGAAAPYLMGSYATPRVEDYLAAITGTAAPAAAPTQSIGWAVPDVRLNLTDYWRSHH